MENGNETTLEDNLHQQFSENDNSRTTVFTSFLMGIIALFGFYGYVFVNTYKRENWNFDMQEFLLMSFITIGMIFFLALLSLNYGYSFRRDQIIVDNIRKKRYNEEIMKKIFGKIYSPLGKCFCEFIPGFYNLFYWLFFISEIFICCTTGLKIYDVSCSCITLCNFKILIFIIMVFHVCFIFLTIISRCLYFIKYLDLKTNENK